MISISEKGCKDNSLTESEAIALYATERELNLTDAINVLISKGYITAKLDIMGHKIGWRLSQAGKDILMDVILASEKTQQPDEKLVSIAKQLKEIYPKGKKEGTNFYWAEGVALIVKRLKIFFKKYGNDYTEEQIVGATKRYIEDQNGSLKFTKLLKYFIFKEKIGTAGDQESESTLLNYIENEGEKDLSDDWMTALK